jgi:hypothetical protein
MQTRSSSPPLFPESHAASIQSQLRTCLAEVAAIVKHIVECNDMMDRDNCQHSAETNRLIWRTYGIFCAARSRRESFVLNLLTSQRIRAQFAPIAKLNYLASSSADSNLTAVPVADIVARREHLLERLLLDLGPREGHEWCALFTFLRSEETFLLGALAFRIERVTEVRQKSRDLLRAARIKYTDFSLALISNNPPPTSGAVTCGLCQTGGATRSLPCGPCFAHAGCLADATRRQKGGQGLSCPSCISRLDGQPVGTTSWVLPPFLTETQFSDLGFD